MIPGGRLTGKFASDFTIWKVLRQFESGASSGGHNLNITARGTAKGGSTSATKGGGSGQLYYESPVLNIMGRELSNLEDFQKTLSQCGINSGSVLIRVSFQQTAKTLYEAMEHISQYLTEVEPEGEKKEDPSPATAPETKGGATTVEADSSANAPDNKAETALATNEVAQLLPNPEQPAEQQAATENAPESMDVDSSTAPANRLEPVSVFSAPKGTTPAAALRQDSDSAFTPTLAHAQLHQARLQANSQNKRLKSDKELEADAAAEAARLATIKSVQIKVRFPDGTSAQWKFSPEDTGATLFRAVRGVMAHDTQPFRMVMPGAGAGAIRDADGPKHTLVKGYGLRGGVLVSLLWEDGASPAARRQPFLKKSVAGKAQQVVVPNMPVSGPETADKPAGPSVEKKEKSDGLEGVVKKLPKWLKLPGKK